MTFVVQGRLCRFSSLDGVDSGISSINQPPIQAKVTDRDNLSKSREERSQVDGPTIQGSEQDRGNLQTRGQNPDSAGSMTRKGRTPPYLSKKTRRQRKATAKKKVEQDKIDGEDFGFTKGFVMCLPCEDKVYDDEMFSLKCRPSRPLTDEGARTISKPLRPSEFEIILLGSFNRGL